MTDLVSVFEDVLKRIEALGLDYMIVGSVASLIYGEPRLTKDMDLVIEVSTNGLPMLERHFPESEFYVPPSEIVASEISSRGQFNLIHHKSGLKIDLMIRKDSAHSKMEFSRRQRVPFSETFEAFVASPEDVIIKKLSYFREGESQKHLSDIRGIIANTEIDRAYLEEWLMKLGLEGIWKLV